jgi:hypothetical protein
VIDLPPLGALESALWDALLDIADRMPSGWTLIGGQMVLLHGLENGRVPPRVSEDLDLVVDVRVRPPALKAMVEALGDLGFESTGVSADGVAHRFTRGDVGVDLVAPDGVGERIDLRTVGGGVTVEVGGGTFALERSELLEVRTGARTGHVPRPDLAGAILIKAVAVKRDRKRGAERHVRDLAFLLSLAEDPPGLRNALGSRKCRQIGAVAELADPEHEAWRLIDDPQSRAEGQATFALVSMGLTRSAPSATPDEQERDPSGGGGHA